MENEEEARGFSLLCLLATNCMLPSLCIHVAVHTHTHTHVMPCTDRIEAMLLSMHVLMLNSMSIHISNSIVHRLKWEIGISVCVCVWQTPNHYFVRIMASKERETRDYMNNYVHLNSSFWWFEPNKVYLVFIFTFYRRFYLSHHYLFIYLFIAFLFLLFLVGLSLNDAFKSQHLSFRR